MAKKPAVSYAALSLETNPATTEEVPALDARRLPERRTERAGRQTLKEASAHVMLYLNPSAVKALKRYALDQNVKVHDLLIEAVENWFQTHGLKEPVRAVTRRQNSAEEARPPVS